MAERLDNHRIPEWAEQEREGDLEWIRENLDVFWPAARVGYQMVGRGALIVDTTVISEEGHPFGYVNQVLVEREGNEDVQRTVREYEPDAEFVTSLLKSLDRVSSYRIEVVEVELREEWGSRVEPGE